MLNHNSEFIIEFKFLNLNLKYKELLKFNHNQTNQIVHSRKNFSRTQS